MKGNMHSLKECWVFILWWNKYINKFDSYFILLSSHLLICKDDSTDFFFFILYFNIFKTTCLTVFMRVYMCGFYLHAEVTESGFYLKKPAVQGPAKCSIGVLLHFRSVAIASV